MNECMCVCMYPDDGQRNCPKHVEIYSKNKFGKVVHLISFITRIHLQQYMRNFNWVYSCDNLYFLVLRTGCEDAGGPRCRSSKRATYSTREPFKFRSQKFQQCHPSLPSPSSGLSDSPLCSSFCRSEGQYPCSPTATMSGTRRFAASNYTKRKKKKSL